MKKLDTIQKGDRLNDVYRADEPGVSGACHYYVITSEDDPEAYIHTITFQKGPRQDDTAQHGVVDSDLLEIVRDRLKAIQDGPFGTKENACAITHLEAALKWLSKHTEAKIRRQALKSMED